MHGESFCGVWGRAARLCLLLCGMLLLEILLPQGMPEAQASDWCGRIWYNIETVEAIGQTLHIKGWAYDSDAKSATLGIHIYCGKGKDGSDDPHGWFYTDVYRKDVNDAFGLTGNHGFDIRFATQNTGTVNAKLYTFYAGGTSQGGTPALLVDRDVTYHKEYTVHYNANGGSGTPADQTKIEGTALTLSTTRPTWAGHIFQKWNTKSDGSGTSYNPGSQYTANSATTLYAIWALQTYDVTYDANGGSGAPGNQTKQYGVNLTLSSSKPTWTGHLFQKWNTEPNGSGTSYDSGATYTGNADLPLYAVWTLENYTVAYDANGGTGAPDSQTKQYGTVLTLRADIPALEGYTFSGWSSPRSETLYLPGDSFSEEGNTVLTAVWQIIMYDITFDANGGGNAPDPQAKRYGMPLNLSTTIPTREAYIFVGWAESPYATEPVFQPGDAYTGNADLALYALWEPDRFPGDVNSDGSVDGRDAIRLLRYIADQPVTIVPRNADVNDDGVVNGKDALRLLRYLADQDVELR